MEVMSIVPEVTNRSGRQYIAFPFDERDIHPVQRKNVRQRDNLVISINLFALLDFNDK